MPLRILFISTSPPFLDRIFQSLSSPKRHRGPFFVFLFVFILLKLGPQNCGPESIRRQNKCSRIGNVHGGTSPKHPS